MSNDFDYSPDYKDESLSPQQIVDCSYSPALMTAGIRNSTLDNPYNRGERQFNLNQ